MLTCHLNAQPLVSRAGSGDLRDIGGFKTFLTGVLFSTCHGSPTLLEQVIGPVHNGGIAPQ